MNYVFKILTTISKRLETIDNINSGGCAVVAYHVAKHLKDIVPTNIAVYSKHECKDNKIDYARRFVSNPKSMDSWYYDGFADFSHFMVEFKIGRRKYVYDSEGIRRRKQHPYTNLYFIGNVSLEECKAMASNYRGWNQRFYRGDIPSLKGKINRVFEAYAL